MLFTVGLDPVAAADTFGDRPYSSSLHLAPEKKQSEPKTGP